MLLIILGSILALFCLIGFIAIAAGAETSLLITSIIFLLGVGLICWGIIRRKKNSRLLSGETKPEAVQQTEAKPEAVQQTEAKPEAIQQIASFPLYYGSGLCDVCSKNIVAGQAYKVPVNVFYSSEKYKQFITPMAMICGMTADQMIRHMRSNDKTTHSAVCKDCINLFE
jgi:hypothetical protein